MVSIKKAMLAVGTGVVLLEKDLVFFNIMGCLPEGRWKAKPPVGKV